MSAGVISLGGTVAGIGGAAPGAWTAVLSLAVGPVRPGVWARGGKVDT